MKHAIIALLSLTLALAYAQKEIIIRHWYHQYGEDGTFEAAQRYAAEYSEMTPGVTVEINWVPGDYIASLNAALLSNEAPDVFELQTIDLSRVRAGQLAPLDDLFEGVRDDFNETALERVTVDGTLYGVPMILDPQFLYYSESALAEAGLAPPTTMDELIEAAAALDTGRVKGLYLGNDLGSANYLLYMTTAAADTQLIADEEASFDTEANAEMWAKKQTLARSGSLLAGAPTEWWDPSALIDGLTTMQWSGFWAMPQLLDALGEDLGVAPWPAVNADAEPSVFLGGWNQAVNASSPNVAAAKAYVRWLWIENAEVQEDWNLSYGFHIPPRTSIAEGAEALQSGPAAKVLDLVERYAQSTPILWTGAMDFIYTDAHSEVLLNGADPAEALANAQAAVQAELRSLLR